MAIKLYDLVGEDNNKPFSPHCWKTKMSLAHKGLEYESVPTRFTEISKIENGGFSTVPVIRHGKNLVHDSFEIAIYLRNSYPDVGDRLFHGEGGIALSRFVESWTLTQLHGWIAKWAMVDIYNMLGDEDKKYFRADREKRVGKTLEEFVSGREDSIAELTKILGTLRFMLKKQPFLGGRYPRFADYIVFGTFQWLRVVSGLHMIPKDEPVLVWVDRMLDLHEGLGRSVPQANT